MPCGQRAAPDGWDGFYMCRGKDQENGTCRSVFMTVGVEVCLCYGCACARDWVRACVRAHKATAALSAFREGVGIPDPRVCSPNRHPPLALPGQAEAGGRRCGAHTIAYWCGAVSPHCRLIVSFERTFPSGSTRHPLASSRHGTVPPSTEQFHGRVPPVWCGARG